MPSSSIKSVWNGIMVVLLLFTATYMPYQTCFTDEQGQLQTILDYSIDFLFFVDILVNFISAEEYDDGTLIYKQN